MDLKEMTVELVREEIKVYIEEVQKSDLGHKKELIILLKNVMDKIN